jgi:glycerol-3-phosphate dehydrogenase
MNALPRSSPPLNRHRNLTALKDDDTLDVLVLGGGVNGAGIFRELSLQGLRCALVEKDDFAAGASGASTRVAHGGFRYLEQGRLKLVRESSVERNRLVANARHLVRPLQVAIPVESFWGGIVLQTRRFLGAKLKSSLPGLILLRLALAFYDHLGSKDRSLPLRGAVWGGALRKSFPGLSEHLKGIAWSWEGRIGHPERIVVELIEDAILAQPASVALNHVALEGWDGDAVILNDRLGEARIAVKPRLVVNATGAWVDRTNLLLGTDGTLVQGSKGSHLLLDNPALHKALDGRLVFFGDGQSRLCMAYPLEGQVLLGATDIPVDDPENPVTGDDEIAYLLNAAARIYPGIPVEPSQIRYRWCGVRPLPHAGKATTIGDVSRDHHVADVPAPHLPFPLLALVGGKWTTFRTAAEQIADRALALLNHPRSVETAHLPIGGALGLPADSDRDAWIDAVSDGSGLPRQRVETLLARYGSRARLVADYVAGAPDSPLPDAPGYSEREIRFLVHHEMAQTLEDVIARRTTLALHGTLTEALLNRLREIVAEQGGLPDRFGLDGYLNRHGVGVA